MSSSCYTLQGVASQHLGVVSAMLFTIGQLRSTFDLSKQQWRSYRDTVPPLAKDQGRAACFTAADLLATSVLHRVSTSLCIPMSVLSVVATPLFELCAAWSWPQLERSNLLIDLESRRVELIDNERRITVAAVALFVELAPLVAELRQHLIASASNLQGDLAFPPMIAGSRQ